MKCLRKLCLITALLALVGCAGSPAWRSMKMSSTGGEAEENNKKMMNLEVGQSKDSVLIIMGQPTKREAYQLENQRVVEFLFYRTTGWSGNALSSEDAQFTPVAFENKKLVGWGRNFYDNIIKVAVQFNNK